jgi:hypothetical protein
MVLQHGSVLGVQRPRVMHLPPGISSSLGQEFIDLAESVGLLLDDWQQYHVRVATAIRDDGWWAASEYADVDPRQNGKGGVIEALELGFLYLLKTPLVLYSAHYFPTSLESFRRMQRIIDGSDDLRRKTMKPQVSNGKEGFELTPSAGGSRLRYLARSKNAGRGFSAPVVFFDEAFSLDAEAMAALIPTMSAQVNPWAGYFSSAAKSNSTQLHALRRRAMSGDGGRLAYVEHSVDPDDFGGKDSPGWAEARRDPNVWAVANPALGIRISLEAVETELRTMPVDEFDRERLGVPDPEPVEDPPLFPLADWNRLADPSSEFGGKVAFTVDVAPGGEWAAIAMVAMRPDGMPHVELVDHRPGVDWLAGRRAELDRAHRPKVWVRDPSGPAVELVGKFRDLKGRESTEAATRLVSAVAEGSFRWLCDERFAVGLSAAVVGARRKDQGDGNWKWSRLGSQVDISPLVSMTLALWAAPIVARAKPVLL